MAEEAAATPETFRTRLYLTIVMRLALIAVAEAWRAAGIPAAESHQLLSQWLAKQQSTVDETLGDRFRDAGMTALYAEEAATIFQDIETEFAKILAAYNSD